jgi:protein-S-isoprenylcysteine O-methyltransferase Ste14
MELRIYPPMIYKICLVAMLFSLFVFDEGSICLPFRIIGLILFVVGAQIAMKAKRLFMKSSTLLDPLAKPNKLHTQGLFALSRNPMYLGIVVGLFGIALATGFSINLIFPISYFIVMNFYFIRKEEANLKDIFGESYLRYRRVTRRWLC